MNPTRRAAALWLLALCTTGCGGLNSVQKAEYRALQAQNLSVEEKKPGAAAALGILPGGGSFYTRQWGLGIVDLLLWPLSVLWDPIAGYNEAQMINYTVSQDHVRRLRRRELGELDQKLETKAISQEDFHVQRRAIERKYGDAGN